MLTQQKTLLLNYRDRSYIMSALCSNHSDYFNLIKNILNVPLVITSSIMIVINSYDDNIDNLKLYNILLNISTTIIISFMASFKINEKISLFNMASKKFIKNCHKAEDLLFNNLNEITVEDVKNIILEYDNINDSIDFNYIGFIKDNLIKKYKDSNKSMPHILNCVSDLVLSNDDMLNINNNI